MEFEWDEGKRVENLRKHKVDFGLAVEIFEGPHVEAQDTRFPYEEERFLAIGAFEGQHYVVAFTWRSGIRRVISAWRVGPSGARRYQKVLAGGAARHARPR